MNRVEAKHRRAEPIRPLPGVYERGVGIWRMMGALPCAPFAHDQESKGAVIKPGVPA